MRRIAAAFLCVATVVAIASAASGQQAGPNLVIRGVDSTDADAVEVTFAYEGDRAAVADLVLREDGEQQETAVPVPLEGEQDIGIVLAIDASGSMAEGGLIDEVKKAAREFVAASGPNQHIALVSFNATVTLEQDFTLDKEALVAAIDALVLGPYTALYDGIVSSAELFEGSSLQPNIIVFSDGEDSASSADKSQAQAAVDNAGATLFAVGVESPGFVPLSEIAISSGGSAAVASAPDVVGDLFDGIQTTLDRQYVVTYKSSAPSGPVPIELSIGGDQASAEFVMGSDQAGSASLQPQVVEPPSGPAILRSASGMWIALALFAAALGGLLFMVGTSLFGGDTPLNQTLRPYAGGVVTPADDDDDVHGTQMAQTPLLQRIVAMTGSFAERQGLLAKVETLLERANLPLRAAEALFFYVAGVVVVGLLLALAVEPMVALIGLILAALLPPSILNFRANRRRKRFEAVLPDMLQLLASTLRAGFSLMQGVEAVSTEVAEPMGRELRRVVTEARLGRPLEDALDGVTGRMHSPDFAWAVMAIRIQREVGGNLAELLVTVADTMTERERLRRDVEALTAEGRVSAIVLTLLPVGVGVFMLTVNPEYMDPLVDTNVGRALLLGSGLLALFGFWWMKKTVEIEI